MINDNKKENSLIRIASDALVRAGNSIEITKKLSTLGVREVFKINQSNN